MNANLQADDDMDDDRPAGVVSFVPHSANKYPKQKKPRTASSTDQMPAPKAVQPPRTLLKAGELVHVATDVPLTAQHDMFGALDSSTFQVTSLFTHVPDRKPFRRRLPCFHAHVGGDCVTHYAHAAGMAYTLHSRCCH